MDGTLSHPHSIGCYDWISSLPPPSQWRDSELSFPLFSDLVELILTREGIPGVTVYLSFLLNTIPTKRVRERVGHFTEEQLEVISSLLFKYFHSFISNMLFRFQKYGFIEHNDLPPAEELNLSDVDSAVTQKPSYPLVFDSFLLYICLLVHPGLGHFCRLKHKQLASTDVLLAIGPHLETLFVDFYFLSYTFFFGVGFPRCYQSYVSTSKLWKIGIQCIACHFINNYPERLFSTFLCQKLKCTIQLEHHVEIKNNFIQAKVHVDNLICHVLPLEILPPMWKKEDCIWTERYFPSKIVISVVPQCQGNEMILSLAQSTDNPAVQTSTAQSLELAFQTPKEVGIKQSSTTSSTQTLNYWGFEQGEDGSFEWILYDPLSGMEVISSKPQKKSFFRSKRNTWYNNRYTKAGSPFDSKGGVVFAADKYGRTLTWTMNRNMEGKTLKLKVEAKIWLTYWPNVYDTSYYDTQEHDFCEEVELQLTS